MPERIPTKVRGVKSENPDGSSRQEIIDRSLSNYDSLCFERESDNPYDSNAIAVYLDDVEKLQIGYLSADLVKRLAPRLDRDEIILISDEVEKTGEYNEAFGVNFVLEVHTHAEIQAATERRLAQEEEEKKKSIPVKLTFWGKVEKLLFIRKKYRVRWWAAIIGFSTLIPSILVFSPEFRKNLSGVIVLGFLMWIITLICFWPWISWFYVRIKKSIKISRK